jgi:hypothetical protein
MGTVVPNKKNFQYITRTRETLPFVNPSFTAVMTEFAK